MNFITGATGLVGSYLCRYLVAKGEEVLALKRTNSQTDLLGDAVNKVNWIEGDLMDIDCLLEACKQSNKVYHCAAYVSYDPKDKKELFSSNVKGTSNIVNAALENNIEKLLFVSSIAALGKPSMNYALNESAKWEDSKHHSNYGLTKYQAEQEVWRAQAEGLDVVVINPSVILGGGYWNQNAGKLFQYVDKGSKYYSNGVTGFVDVRDVVKIMHQLINSKLNGERYIVNVSNLTYKSLFEHIAKAINKTAPAKQAPNEIANILSSLDWLKSKLTGSKRFLTKETVLSSKLIANYKNDKIVSALDYTFMPIEETIQETGEVFTKSKQKGFGLLEF